MLSIVQLCWEFLIIVVSLFLDMFDMFRGCEIILDFEVKTFQRKNLHTMQRCAW